MKHVKYRRPRRLVLAIAAAAIGSLSMSAAAFADQPSSTGGFFVIGNQNAAVGSQVTFWGAQWWKDNALSGGDAPASFKGFADTATATCGEQWTTRPGNSSQPPDVLPVTPGNPMTMPVVVSSLITKSGPVISGDTAEVVLVAPDPGYAPDPGHPGTGTVVSVVCPGGRPRLN
jgi:hypothetical protein